MNRFDPIDFYFNMDKDRKWLETINEDLGSIRCLMSAMIAMPCKQSLSLLINRSKEVKNRCQKIRKFFEDNYLELPRKFTDEGRRGINISLFVNAVERADEVNEILS